MVVLERTVYDTQVAVATLETAATATTNLASQGYIITAMGGDAGLTDNILVVGTRVRGDSLPRPMLVLQKMPNTSNSGYRSFTNASATRV